MKENESLFSFIEQPDLPDAECRDRPDLPWVADHNEPSLKYAQDEMHRICQRCAHLSECLMFALLNPSIVGVWGGTTTKERATMRRNRRLHIVDRSA